MKHVSISVPSFIFIFALCNSFFYHIPLYQYTFEELNVTSINGLLTLCCVIVSIFVVTSVILFVLAFFSTKVLKSFVLFVVIANSIAFYFMVHYHVVLDKTMMGNLLNTDIEEARSFYHPKMFWYILIGGLVPFILVLRLKLIAVARKMLVIYGGATLIFGIIFLYLNASTWLWLDKHAKTLGGLSLPWSYTINLMRYEIARLKKNQKQILLPLGKIKNHDKTIVLLVIGESARAKNFSLYGYEHNTNLYLKKDHVTVLPNAIATATYTTASVHSILSYQGSDSDTYEPLPNYLQRMGVEVIWHSSNWGEPVLHVFSYMKNSELRKRCKGEGCAYDEVLLQGLQEQIQKSHQKKIFIVLHTSGSHGPTYYKKYPKRFEHFQPVCKTVDLKSCTQQSLINAYDNTILYTDYFLHKTIEFLKKQTEYATLMLYISDHGESLGEYGLYLHGTPYMIAPDVQKEIPFIVWSSDKFAQNNILKHPFSDTYGHTNIFHTVVGSFSIESPIYNAKMDIFKHLVTHGR